MSVASLPQPPAKRPPQIPLQGIVVGHGVCLPHWVSDLDTFRQWCLTKDYPRFGRIDFINGDIWVDLAMDDYYGHNQVKHEIGYTVTAVFKAANSGRYSPDRMRFVHPGVGLSCEPDGAFASWETFRSGKLRPIHQDDESVMELEGAADMVLEVVSKTSVAKDTKDLRVLYWQAGVNEYWLVDVRNKPIRYEILSRGATEFVATATVDGFQKSVVFGKELRLMKQTDPLGRIIYGLEVR